MSVAPPFFKEAQPKNITIFEGGTTPTISGSGGAVPGVVPQVEAEFFSQQQSDATLGSGKRAIYYGWLVILIQLKIEIYRFTSKLSEF